METQELIIVDVFCKEYQIEYNLLQELENFGLVEIVVSNQNKYLHKNELVYIEKIIRLQRDLNINNEGIEVILNLLDKEKQLLEEIKYLKNRLNLYE